MDFQDGDPAYLVRAIDQHLSIEPPGARQGRIENLRPVGGGEENDPLFWIEPVELDQELIERLFLLVLPAQRKRAAGAPERVELVDEDNAGGLLSRLRSSPSVAPSSWKCLSASVPRVCATCSSHVIFTFHGMLLSVPNYRTTIWQAVNFWYAILAMTTVLLLQSYWMSAQHTETIPYSKFEELLKAGAVKYSRQRQPDQSRIGTERRLCRAQVYLLDAEAEEKHQYQRREHNDPEEQGYPDERGVQTRLSRPIGDNASER
jgi:hypothetical protein